MSGIQRWLSGGSFAKKLDVVPVAVDGPVFCCLWLYWVRKEANTPPPFLLTTYVQYRKKRVQCTIGAVTALGTQGYVS